MGWSISTSFEGVGGGGGCCGLQGHCSLRNVKTSSSSGLQCIKRMLLAPPVKEALGHCYGQRGADRIKVYQLINILLRSLS